VDDKLSILDIKARDQLGRQYNVEMQMEANWIYPQRALYYWAVLHGQQLHGKMDYPDLKPTISISIVDCVLFPQVPDYHLDFRFRSSRHPELIFCSQQSMHLLELPKFRRPAAELADPLDIWCYFLVHGADLDTDNLPAALRTPPVQWAMEVLHMLTQSEIERERYQARLKFQRDQSSNLKVAREEGAVLGRIQLCQELLNLPITPHEELLALSLAELRAKVEALEKQLGVPRS
jgi:predicted transposase/invertase (TIGR01784 family)